MTAFLFRPRILSLFRVIVQRLFGLIPQRLFSLVLVVQRLFKVVVQ